MKCLLLAPGREPVEIEHGLPLPRRIEVPVVEEEGVRFFEEDDLRFPVPEGEFPPGVTVSLEVYEFEAEVGNPPVALYRG